MSFTTLAGLKTAAAAWFERAGASTVATIIDDCVVLCEARINQVPDLRVREMETAPSAITLTSGSGALPTDFLGMKAVIANTTSAMELTYRDESTYLRETARTGTDDGYEHYTIIGTTIRSRSSATLSIVYYAKVPPLATTDPNWLLTKAPNVYLYGLVLELMLALEDANADKWGALFASAVQGLIGSETFSRGGPLVRSTSSQVA